jgi:hypothetical protein
MFGWYSAIETRRTVLSRCSAITAILVCVCLLATALATAQKSTANQGKTFTVKPLTPGRTSSAPKKGSATARRSNTRVATGEAKAKSLRKAVVSATGICDVTIAPGPSPAGGYLPLSAFGVTPLAGVSDDSLTDVDTPPFTFAGEVYSHVRFASNGYVIIGSSNDPGDNTTVNQSFPDPTTPNNVLAPFWTDLNPESGGNLYVGVLTDGSDNWIVLDWESVSEFNTLNQNTFEIWIGVNGDANPGEDISYAYSTMQGSGNGGFLTVGAENKSGTHGQNYYFNGAGTLPANGTQLRVSTTSCLSAKPWTAAGSTGTIDEANVNSAALANFVLGFVPGTTGTINARYNITPTDGISSFCPATSSHVTIRFRDEDDVGAASQVIVTIHQSNIASGGNNTIFTFDSNVSAQPVGSAFQTFSTDAPIDFDFSTNVYWAEAQVIRSNANAFVNLGSIQIFENGGTPCP